MNILRRFITGAMLGSLAMAGLVLVTPQQGQASIIPSLCSTGAEGQAGQLDCFTTGVYDNSTGKFYANGVEGGTLELETAVVGTDIQGVQADGANWLYNYAITVAPGETLDSTQPSAITFFNIGGYISGSALANSFAVPAIASIADPGTPIGPVIDEPGWELTATADFTVTYVDPSDEQGPSEDDGIAFESTLGPAFLANNSPNTAYQAIETSNDTTGYGQYATDLPTATPEPTTLALMGGALFGLGMIRRRAVKK